MQGAARKIVVEIVGGGPWSGEQFPVTLCQCLDGAVEGTLAEEAAR